MRRNELVVVLALAAACSKSSPARSNEGSAQATEAAAPSGCARLDAPATQMFARMETHIGQLEKAFAEAGEDCALLGTALARVDTAGYLAALEQLAHEMKPHMTPDCEPHLDELGGAAQARYQPRFEQVLGSANAAGGRCTDPAVQDALRAALRVFKKQR